MTPWLRPSAWRARRAAAGTDWRRCDFLVVDFETTGLDARRAVPVSVGWVPVRGGSVVLGEAGYRRIHPPGGVPAASMRFHHLLPEDLADAPSARDVGALLRTALDGHLLVAHGAYLELGMLRRCGIVWPRSEVVDTLGLARSLDRLERRGVARDASLAAVAVRLGLPAHRPHHAFGDALTTAGVLLALATGLERHGAATRGALVRLGKSR